MMQAAKDSIDLGIICGDIHASATSSLRIGVAGNSAWVSP